MTAQPPWSRRAVWSLALGAASVLGCGLITGIPAMTMGAAARRDVRLTGGARRGRGLASVGFLLGLIGTVLSVVVLTYVLDRANFGPDRKPWTHPAPAAEPSPSELKPFYTQKVHWDDCDDGYCAKVTVPVDYLQPEGETTKVAVRVVPSTGSGHRSLFVNPGGPGASAQSFAQYFAANGDREIRRRYDIVGVDPRGVADSDPLDCLSHREMDRFTVADPDPDSPEEVRDFRAQTQQMGEGCLRRSGPLAAHVSTEEAARDLDIVRVLLGRKKLDYFGASYGTQLGATYATLFPERSGRLVLDGAVGPALGSMDASLGQARGFGRALRAYLADCVKDRDCPLGRDVGRANGKIRKLLETLDQRPMKTADSRRLTESQAYYGIALTLYEKATWPGLTSGLAAAMSGDGTVLLKLSDAYFGRESDGSYDSNLGESFAAVTCLDTRDRPSFADVQAAMPKFTKASSVFGSMFAFGALRCSDWPIEATHPQIELDAAGADPIIVLGTTRDPATPYEWAEDMATALKPAVLVTRDGDGHTAYQSGDRCVRRIVDDFLVRGTVPKPGIVCD
jgi:pimeloyl-ACP methyl ester carboxylesterase